MPYKDKESQARGRRRYRQSHREKGLCTECPEPAMFPFVLCKRHREKRIGTRGQYNKDYRDGLKERKRCTRCSLILLEMDGDNLTCETCRAKGVWKHGSYC